MEDGDRTADRKCSVATLAEHSVLEVEDLKRAPEFMMGGSGIGSVTRTVAENSPAGTYVGAPIPAAIDPDTNTTLVYTLGGVDEEYFALARMDHGTCDEQGQLEVSTRQIVVVAPLVREVDVG